MTSHNSQHSSTQCQPGQRSVERRSENIWVGLQGLETLNVLLLLSVIWWELQLIGTCDSWKHWLFAFTSHHILLHRRELHPLALRRLWEKNISHSVKWTVFVCWCLVYWPGGMYELSHNHSASHQHGSWHWVGHCCTVLLTRMQLKYVFMVHCYSHYVLDLSVHSLVYNMSVDTEKWRYNFLMCKLFNQWLWTQSYSVNREDKENQQILSFKEVVPLHF